MSCQNTQDFCMALGETFAPIIRWGSDVLSSKAITAVSQAAPAVVTAAAHGVPDGWLVAVVGVAGMTQINTQNYPPRGTDWVKASLVDTNNVQLNKVSSAGYAAYTSGGFLVFNTPVSLAGATGVFTIWDAPVGGNVLATLTSSPAAGLTLNDTTKQILPVLATAALLWNTGYYRLDITDSTGVTTQVLSGTIAVN